MMGLDLYWQRQNKGDLKLRDVSIGKAYCVGACIFGYCTEVTSATPFFASISRGFAVTWQSGRSWVITYFFYNPYKTLHNQSAIPHTQSGQLDFKYNYRPSLSIIKQMHRYGLVYLWHNRELQNQNRSLTKERRDGDPPTPRNRNTANRTSKYARPNCQKSMQSDPLVDNTARMGDVEVSESEELKKVRGELQVARRRVQKVVRQIAQVEKKVSQIEAVFKDSPDSPSDCQRLQLAKRERERLEKERLSALEDFQSKERLLEQLQYRKLSL